MASRRKSAPYPVPPPGDWPGEPRCGHCGDLACCPRLEERVKVLEGHRNQWRRIAFRLEEELRKHDRAACDAVFESADVEALERQGTEGDGR